MASNSADFYRTRRIADHPRRQTSPRRVHDLLRAGIRDGRLRPGQRLVETALVQEFGTSRNAIREAMQDLAAEGLVTRRPREGTMVAGEILRIPLDQLYAERDSQLVTTRRIETRRLRTTPEVAARLGHAVREVNVTEVLYLLRGEPIAVWVDYVDADFVQPTFFETSADMASSFERFFGAPFGRMESTLEARLCELRTMRLLGLTEPAAVLVRELVLFDEDDLPRALVFAHYRADRVSFSH
ncbi:MAG: GntR family transcriptional regulator [Ilumatobacteraceae bacterium]